MLFNNKENDKYPEYKDPRDKPEEYITKKRAAIMCIVSVVITLMLTTVIPRAVGVYTIVPTSKYKEYQKLDKVIRLKEAIEEKFYKKPDEQMLEDGMLKGLFAGTGDVYSNYLTKNEMKRMMELSEGRFDGIGAYIGLNEEGRLVIVKPFKNSPAMRGGLKTEDIILKVDGKEVNAKNFVDGVNHIKGKTGTKVKLTIQRGSKIMEKTFVRERINEESIEYKMLEDKIGYIRINSFVDSTYKDFDNALKALKEQGMKGIIFDLRGNGGGLITSVKNVCDDILGNATIVYTENNKGFKNYIKSSGSPINIPIAVLTDKDTASAAEIFTGAVRDNKVGISIGTTTYGKGLVQSVIGLSDGTGYKLTTYQYFTPSGKNINQKGIKPDIVVKDEKKQLPEAIKYIKSEIERVKGSDKEYRVK